MDCTSSTEGRATALAITVGTVDERRNQLAEISTWATQLGKRIISSCEGETVADALSEITSARSKMDKGERLDLWTTSQIADLLGERGRALGVHSVEETSLDQGRLIELLSFMLSMRALRLG
jgi:hypothetical protein